MHNMIIHTEMRGYKMTIESRLRRIAKKENLEPLLDEAIQYIRDIAEIDHDNKQSYAVMLTQQYEYNKRMLRGYIEK